MTTESSGSNVDGDPSAEEYREDCNSDDRTTSKKIRDKPVELAIYGKKSMRQWSMLKETAKD